LAVLGAVALAALGFFDQVFWLALLLLVAVHMIVSFTFGLLKEGIAMGFFVAFGSLLTHAFYGVFFVIGLLLPKLKR
jgi:ABC-type multidrug transport system permease subunit